MWNRTKYLLFIKDETVENSIAYELNDDKTSIKFIIEEPSTGETLGEEKFDID